MKRDWMTCVHFDVSDGMCDLKKHWSAGYLKYEPCDMEECKMKNRVTTLEIKNMRKNFSLGSHNSWTYQKPTNWFMRPFAGLARCQSRTIAQQYLVHNVNCYDLRLKWDKKLSSFVTAHGLIKFGTNVTWWIDLSWLNEKAESSNKKIYVRVLLEETRFTRDTSSDLKFMDECAEIQKKFPALVFFGGTAKRRGFQLYNFHTQEPTLDDKYASVTDGWRYVLANKCFAKKYNAENKKAGTEKDFLFIDYVEIG